MNRHVVNINEFYTKKHLREKVDVLAGPVGKSRLRGAVEIYDKNSNGTLNKIRQKENLIVYEGRSWLLKRAFGEMIIGSESDIYNKIIRWFGVGSGGGEPGNPLQAGATYGHDTNLLQQTRMRTDLVIGDPGYSLYASDYNGDHGYYKKFSSVVIKEDRANPYVINNVTYYPPLIAEIRIELSSDDANGGSYEDLNEAALFVADPSEDDPGLLASTGGALTGTADIIKVTKDNDYAIYTLDTTDLSSIDDLDQVNVGDTMWVDGSPINSSNLISEISPALVVDMFNGGTGISAYIVVEKADAVDEDPITPGDVEAHFNDKIIQPYSMFSRVTFSTIRKTVDREIVFLWKIYF